MEKLLVNPIGLIENTEDAVCIRLEEKYAVGLRGLSGYSHVQVVWWMDGCDNESDRSILVESKPYRHGSDELGVFALRSPERPNPIAISNARILVVDEGAGLVRLAWIDARNGSPVLDLKPYTPSIDRVRQASTPDWCRHWPQWVEDSGSFNWADEFNF